jgi:hypothetical protein
MWEQQQASYFFFWSVSLVVWLWFLFLLCKKWFCQLLLLR